MYVISSKDNLKLILDFLIINYKNKQQRTNLSTLHKYFHCCKIIQSFGKICFLLFFLLIFLLYFACEGLFFAWHVHFDYYSATVASFLFFYLVFAAYWPSSFPNALRWNGFIFYLDWLYLDIILFSGFFLFYLWLNLLSLLPLFSLLSLLPFLLFLLLGYVLLYFDFLFLISSDNILFRRLRFVLRLLNKQIVHLANNPSHLHFFLPQLFNILANLLVFTQPLPSQQKIAIDQILPNFPLNLLLL